MTFIVIVNVIDILNGQKFSFPMNCDSGYKVKHLKHEMETLVHRLGDHRLLFIRNGRIADEDEYIIMPRFHGPETISSLDFFFMAQPKAKVTDMQEAVCVLDDINLAAAKEWVASNRSYGNKEEVQKRQNILRNMQQLSTDEKERSAPIPAPVPAPNPLVDGHAVRWFDLNIICRFVLGYVLFVNGSSIIRQLLFFNFAVLCYLYATGIGKFFLDIIAKNFLPPDRDNGLQDAVNGNNNNNENTPTTDTTPGTNESEMDTDADTPGAPTPARDSDPHTARVPERPVPWSEMFIQTVHTFYSRGAPIPVGRHGGAALDALSLLASLTLSLIPEWSPYGRV